MMTADTNSRIRWNDTELDQVAGRMMALQVANPKMSLLDAVREAQAVLPEDRQREIKTWTAMAARLQPKLDQLAQSGLLFAASTAAAPPAAATSAPSSLPTAESIDSFKTGTPVHEATDTAATEVQPVLALAPAAVAAIAPPAPHEQPAPAQPAASQGSTPGPLQLEASMLAALQSPVIERALVDLFGRAMAQAFTRFAERDAPEPSAEPRHEPSSARVLLAGFAAAQSKQLADALSHLCEVRQWKPAQGPQLFETLANICNIAVIPDEFDEEADADLRRRKLTVIRHGGTSAKLVERLETVLQS